MSAPTCIITGGSRGLGRALSLAFGRAGYRVVALYRSDQSAAAELTALFQEGGITGKVVQQDVTEEAGMEKLGELPEISGASGLTLIHNSCAAFEPRPLHLLRWEDFESSLAGALKGGWLSSQAVIRPMLKARRGCIVNVLTAALHQPPPKGFAAYLAAKHALRGYTQALAAEYSGRGVRVFSVSPGFMRTPLTERWEPRLRDAILAAAPVSDPAQVADRVRALVENAGTPGQGEDYLV